MKKKGIFSDMGLKILSVALAMSLWFFVTYRGQSEMAIDAPIEFKNVPWGLEILRQSIKRVSLNISGHERLLKALRPMDVRVVIDMSDAKKGEAVYYFDRDNVIIPRTIKVQRIEPVSVKMTLDESTSKTVPVKAYVVGAPEKGYRIKSIEVKPSVMEIEGAKTEIARISLLRTEAIDVTGMDSDMTQNARINTNGRNVRTKASEVTVKINIRRVGK
jgi:YbbR domain-containing protein